MEGILDDTGDDEKVQDGESRRKSKEQSTPSASKKRVSIAELPKTTAEIEANQHKIQKELQQFLIEQEGSVLRAWFQHFDPEHRYRVTAHQFMKVMREYKHPGDCLALFQGLDEDGEGELTLKELSEETSALWNQVWKWMVTLHPGGAENFFKRVKGGDEGPGHGTRFGMVMLQEDSPKASVEKDAFIAYLRNNGWEQGSEELIFDALSKYRQVLTATDMKWLDKASKRQQRKEKAKHAVENERQKALKFHRKDPKTALHEFKRFLKHKHGGSLIRAFRKSLAPTNATMTLQRGQFAKACAMMHWKRDVRLIWEAMDKDGSGTVGVEEFDFKGAEALAHFANFCATMFGTSQNTFAALDLDGSKSLSESEFFQALHELQFPDPDVQIFEAMDLDCRKMIVEADLAFLDTWSPTEYLLAEPDEKATNELKQVIIRKCGSYLQAWRAFDSEGTNTCNWDTFKAVCKRFGFKKSAKVAGVWRFLDRHMAGSISLADFEPSICEPLQAFRDWAVQEFGSVKAMFAVFDDDKSGSLTVKEFKSSCHFWGFDRPLRQLFDVLDARGNGVLSSEEVSFLDHWAEKTEDIQAEQEKQAAASRLRKSTTREEIEMKRKEEGEQVANSLGSSEWPDGALHPAFRSWCNNRRRLPVRKFDGTLPPLSLQVDPGPSLAKRPILLMAYLPHGGSFSARSPRQRRSRVQDDTRTGSLPPSSSGPGRPAATWGSE